MKNKWNNIFGGLLMDAAAEGTSSAGASSFFTPAASGGKVPTTPGDAGTAPGASGDKSTVDAAAGNASAGTGATDWRLALSKELQEDASIKKFPDVSTLAKSYINAQKLIGSDKIVVPTKYTTDEEWAAISRKLGVPEKVEEYKVKFKEGVSVDDKFSKDFIATAHKAGVLPKQAQALADWFSEVNMGTDQQMTKQMNDKFTKGLGELKAEWGNAFDLNIARANKAAMELGGQEMVDHFNLIGVGGDKRLIQFLAKVGQTMYGEDKFVEGQGTSAAMTPVEMDKQIGSLQANPAYLDKHHPSHKSLVKEVADLYAQRYPDKK